MKYDLYEGVEMFVHKLLEKAKENELTKEEIKGLNDVGIEFDQCPSGSSLRDKFHVHFTIHPKFEQIANYDAHVVMEEFRRKHPLYVPIKEVSNGRLKFIH